ncbi:MAG: hypothetical protein ABI573_03525 [Chloroflexota bacterium]
MPSTSGALAGTIWEHRAVWFENADGLEPSVNRVIHTSSGFVAWGPTEFGSAVMTSDGIGWTRSADDQATFDGLAINAMAESSAGIVAIGIRDSRFGPDPTAPVGSDLRGFAHVWRSPDGGATWMAGPLESGIDGVVEDVVGYKGGFVAVGSAKGGCDVAVWLSDDGFRWRPAHAPPGAAGTCVRGEVMVSPGIARVRVGPTGLVAFGSIPGVGGAFWTSADGVGWTFHPQASMGGGPGAATLLEFTTGGPGYVAVGTSGWPDAAVVWTSTDGAAWMRVPDQPTLAGAYMAAVASLDDKRLVAIGQDAAGQFASWTSDDGLQWRRERPSLPPGEVPAWGVQVTGLATDGQRAIAVSGGSWEWTSPPVTSGLRSAQILLTLSGPVTFRPNSVSGTCSAAEDGGADTHVEAAFSNPPPYGPNDLNAWIEVSPAGALTAFTLSADGLLVALGQGSPIDPAMFAVKSGSTAGHGRVDFRGVVNELDPTWPKALAGSFEWTCDG